MSKPEFGVLPANPTSSAPGDAVSAGASGDKDALASHKHAREAWGVSGDYVQPGVAAAGTSGHVADAGHVHPMQLLIGMQWMQVSP